MPFEMMCVVLQIPRPSDLHPAIILSDTAGGIFILIIRLLMKMIWRKN